MTTSPGNTIHALVLYRDADAWVFDDARFGLVAEPFVFGASELIDVLSDTYRGQLQLLASASPFPRLTRGFYTGAATLQWVESEAGGEIYRAVRGKATGMACWFCPAFRHYFPGPPPPMLWLVVRPLTTFS